MKWHIPWYCCSSSLASLNQRRAYAFHVSVTTGERHEAMSRHAPCGTVTSFPSTVRVMSACLDDEEANVRRPNQRDGRRGRLGTRSLEPNKLGGIPGRVDDGVAATLASTPADEGLEADDTSRSMALRRREVERGVQKSSAHVGGVLTARKECKTTRSSPNTMTKLRLSPSVTAPASLAAVIWRILIGQRLFGSGLGCPANTGRQFAGSTSLKHARYPSCVAEH